MSEDYQKNQFISLSIYYNQKWSLSLSSEATNSDESKFNNTTIENFDYSNSWNSVGLSYRFDSDDILQLFYGSMRGGLDCTNGVCRYIQAFEDGVRIDYTANFN